MQQQPSGQRQEQQEDNQEQNMMRQPLEGALSKYTNVMKGWQYRWFVLSPDSGMLEYYMMEDREFKKQRPRGAVFLAGAVISPSDEDGQTFSLSPACGEAYKLRAADAKERQYWVTRLRAVAEHHTGTLTNVGAPPPANNQHHPSNQEPHPTFLPGSLSESLGPVRKMLLEAERCHLNLAQTISELPSEGNKNAKCIDNDLLMMKATSYAALQSLDRCYSVLQDFQTHSAHMLGMCPAGGTIRWADGSQSPVPPSMDQVRQDSPQPQVPTTSAQGPERRR